MRPMIKVTLTPEQHEYMTLQATRYYYLGMKDGLKRGLTKQEIENEEQEQLNMYWKLYEKIGKL